MRFAASGRGVYRLAHLPCGHVAELVNIHTLFAASELPNVSFAPVVIVAVKIVLGARGPEGVKVAILVEEL